MSYMYNLLFLFSTNMVMNYTEVEAKVREATNDEAWGPTGEKDARWCMGWKVLLAGDNGGREGKK